MSATLLLAGLLSEMQSNGALQLGASPLGILTNSACTSSAPVDDQMSKLERAEKYVFCDFRVVLRKSSIERSRRKVFEKKWVDHFDVEHNPQATVSFFPFTSHVLPRATTSESKREIQKWLGQQQAPRSYPTQNHAHGHDERNTHFPRSPERRSYALANAAEENAAYFGAIKTGYSENVRRDSAEDSGTEWRNHVSQCTEDVCFCSLKQTTPSRQVIHHK